MKSSFVIWSIHNLSKLTILKSIAIFIQFHPILARLCRFWSWSTHHSLSKWIIHQHSSSLHHRNWERANFHIKLVPIPPWDHEIASLIRIQSLFYCFLIVFLISFPNLSFVNGFHGESLFLLAFHLLMCLLILFCRY